VNVSVDPPPSRLTLTWTSATGVAFSSSIRPVRRAGAGAAQAITANVVAKMRRKRSLHAHWPAILMGKARKRRQAIGQFGATFRTVRVSVAGTNDRKGPCNNRSCCRRTTLCCGSSTTRRFVIVVFPEPVLPYIPTTRLGKAHFPLSATTSDFLAFLSRCGISARFLAEPLRMVFPFAARPLPFCDAACSITACAAARRAIGTR
jgi:hypothetical protein